MLWHPPSIHPSGVPYKVEKDIPLAELPQTIIDLYNSRPISKKTKSKQKSKSSTNNSKNKNFVMIFYDELQGMARKKLSGAQAIIYLYMLRKCGKKDNGKYLLETIFECPYSFIRKDLGYDDPTTGRSLPKLIKKGFIELVRQGGSHDGKKETSLYRLSNNWKET